MDDKQKGVPRPRESTEGIFRQRPPARHVTHHDVHRKITRDFLVNRTQASRGTMSPTVARIQIPRSTDTPQPVPPSFEAPVQPVLTPTPTPAYVPPTQPNPPQPVPQPSQPSSPALDNIPAEVEPSPLLEAAAPAPPKKPKVRAALGSLQNRLPHKSHLIKLPKTVKRVVIVVVLLLVISGGWVGWKVVHDVGKVFGGNIITDAQAVLSSSTKLKENRVDESISYWLVILLMTLVIKALT
jgi:hypothetical protein